MSGGVMCGFMEYAPSGREARRPCPWCQSPKTTPPHFRTSCASPTFEDEGGSWTPWTCGRQSVAEASVARSCLGVTTGTVAASKSAGFRVTM